MLSTTAFSPKGFSHTAQLYSSTVDVWLALTTGCHSEICPFVCFNEDEVKEAVVLCLIPNFETVIYVYLSNTPSFFSLSFFFDV